VSIGEFDIDTTLVWDPEKAKEIEQSDLMPEGPRVVKFDKCTIEPRVSRDGREIAGRVWEEGDGLLQVNIQLRTVEEWDPQQLKNRVDFLRLMYLNDDVDLETHNEATRMMHQRSLLTIQNIVKAANITIPHDGDSQHVGRGLTENLAGAMVQVRVGHSVSKQNGRTYVNYNNWRAFDPEEMS